MFAEDPEEGQSGGPPVRMSDNAIRGWVETVSTIEPPVDASSPENENPGLDLPLPQYQPMKPISLP